MKPRATVIIPTYGTAGFARWALQSVQHQTVQDLEICIICDGSPDEMVSFFRRLGQEDPRVRVFSHPKSPRTGEPYRDEVIKRTTGAIICYCSHDDLWLPNHVEIMEKTLKTARFTHSLHAKVKLPELQRDEEDLFESIHCFDIRERKIVRPMLGGEANFFGLTYAAHTRKSYQRLPEGWVTTPPGVPTDLYMWGKFLAAEKHQCRTIMRITALSFPYPDRKSWSAQERDDELQRYYRKMQDKSFLRKIAGMKFRLPIEKRLRLWLINR